MREDPTSPRSSSGPARLRPLEILSLCCGVVLTADAAVESWPHAGVRWWAVGAAVVYAAVAGLSWRRGVSWKVNLLAALATLLGAVAITAWVPGGTSDGIRLFTLSTPRVLALVVAAGVVLAGLAVTQLARVPVAARAAVAALALYGTAA